MYSPYFIDKQIKSFLNNKLSEYDTSKDNYNKEKTINNKLPYIGDILLGLRKR